MRTYVYFDSKINSYFISVSFKEQSVNKWTLFLVVYVIQNLAEYTLSAIKHYVSEKNSDIYTYIAILFRIYICIYV